MTSKCAFIMCGEIEDLIEQRRYKNSSKNQSIALHNNQLIHETENILQFQAYKKNEPAIRLIKPL